MAPDGVPNFVKTEQNIAVHQVHLSPPNLCLSNGKRLGHLRADSRMVGNSFVIGLRKGSAVDCCLLSTQSVLGCEFA